MGHYNSFYTPPAVILIKGFGVGLGVEEVGVSKNQCFLFCFFFQIGYARIWGVEEDDKDALD